MKFKILKYKTNEVKDIVVSDEDCEYSIGWLELEIDGEVKMLCIEMCYYIGRDYEEIEFGFSKEWNVKRKLVDEWINEGSELYNNIFRFLESWDKKLDNGIDFTDVYDWDSRLIGYQFEK